MIILIYITGDTHGNIDRFNNPQVKKFTQEDILIVCGDFGFIWNGDQKEEQLLNKLSKKKFTIAFVDGTHENFELLNKYPIENWNGGKVHKIGENIYHLMRGEVFNIGEESLFTMGGGESSNKDERILAGMWWKEELPSDQEINYAKNKLSKINNKIDYVITHEPPLSVRSSIVGEPYNVNSLDIFLSKLSEELRYKKWFFGSLHIDRKITASFYSVFDAIVSTKLLPQKKWNIFRR